MLAAPSRTILHISDTHILPTDDERLHGVDTMRNLRLVLERAAADGVRPDAIVLSGDLANDGEPHSYERLRPVIDELGIRSGAPLMLAMGNHDARAAFRVGLLDEPASDDPIYYAGWVDGLRIIVLDSTVPGAPHGELDTAQLAWLRTELATPADEGTLLVLHHPPTPSPIPLVNLLLLRNPEALAEAIEGSDVLAVLAGHAHHPIATTFAGALCFAAPASAYTVAPIPNGDGFRGIDGSGFGLLHLYGRTTVASAVALPGDGRELYRFEATEELIQRWSSAPVAAR